MKALFEHRLMHKIKQKTNNVSRFNRSNICVCVCLKSERRKARQKTHKL